MAMAAGKSAGKPPRMTVNAFNPPTEAAMAMTGNKPFSGEPGMREPARTAVRAAAFFDRRFILVFDTVFVFIIRRQRPKIRRVGRRNFQGGVMDEKHLMLAHEP
jgi:hypothetical protein